MLLDLNQTMVTDCVCVLMLAHSVVHVDGAVRFLEREAKDIGLPFKSFEVGVRITVAMWSYKKA